MILTMHQAQKEATALFNKAIREAEASARSYKKSHKALTSAVSVVTDECRVKRARYFLSRATFYKNKAERLRTARDAVNAVLREAWSRAWSRPVKGRRA